MDGWLRVGPSDANTGIAASSSDILNMSISGDENNRLSAGISGSSYSHSEQIRYSMEPSQLPVQEPRAAMQKADRSNHEYPLGPLLRRTYLLVLLIPQEILHDTTRLSRTRLRLAHAGRHHPLRLSHFAARLRAALLLRLLPHAHVTGKW